MSEQPNLDEIRARCEAIKRRPVEERYASGHRLEWDLGQWSDHYIELDRMADAKEEFDDHTPTDVPALLALVDRLITRVGELEAENARLREQVEAATPKRPDYGEPKAWVYDGPPVEVWFKNASPEVAS